MTKPDRWRSDVESALRKISSAIEEVVRAEQQRNDLTGLPNELALNAQLEDLLEKDTNFWCAFIEIDHFKRVNTIYKYEAANALLQAVASTIRNSAEHTFNPSATAYHAHGDEFYTVGVFDAPDTLAEQIRDSLDRMREQISGIQKGVSGHDVPMSATVTVGWLSRSDIADTDVTRPHIRKCIELAVDRGKRLGRNITIRYDASVQNVQVYSERGNCANHACQASFTVDADASELTKGEHLWCPNCGTQQPRPAQPEARFPPVADI